MNTTPKRDLFEIFSRRAFLLSAGGLGALGAVGARIVWLQAEDVLDKEYTKAADENRFDLRPIVPPRGIIYDRFGDALALSSKDYRVTIVPEETDDLEATIRTLGGLIGLSEDIVKRRIRDAKTQRPWDEFLIRNGLEWPQFAAVNVRLPELKGVRATVGEQRYYPYKSAFAHPIGYVQKPSQRDIDIATAKDREAAGLPEKPLPNENFESPTARYFRNPDVRIGKAGLEAGLERQLRGEPGRRQVEVNAAGRVVSEVGREQKRAVPGSGIVLTIDAELQRLAMERLGGQSGAAVVIDIWTGDLIVMASAPGFDPNAFVNGIPFADFKVLNEDPYKPLFHKCVTGAYSPGSTFKCVTALAVQEAGVDPNFRVNCPGYYWFGGRRFHCWARGGHGSMDLRNGIKHSCDVYFYVTSLMAGQQRIADTARALGMGQKFDIGVPSTVAGVVPDRAWWAQRRGSEPWPPGMTLNTAIGQGDVLGSPLQLAVVAARLANGGKAVVPRLVHEGPDVAPTPPPPAQLPFPKDHIDRVLDAMIAISNEPGGTALGSGDLKLVHDGKGKTYDAANAPPGLERVRMGGKTGTAQVRVITMAERASGVRSNAALPWHLRDNALFICFAPIHAPRYACAAVVEHGGGGSAVAAPIARDIMRATLIRDPSNQPAMRLARTTSLPLTPGSDPG